MNSRRLTRSPRQRGRAASRALRGRACVAVWSVDDQLELSRLHDRQVRRLRALEDATRIDADLTIRIQNARSVAHQSAGFGDIRATRCHAGSAWRAASSGQLDTPAEQKAGRHRRKARRAARAQTFAKAASISRLVLALKTLDLQSHGASSRFHVPQHVVRVQLGVVRTDEHGNASDRGHQAHAAAPAALLSLARRKN